MMRLLRSDDVDALASVDLGLAAARETAELLARGSVSTGRLQVGDDAAWTRILVGIIAELDILGYKQFHRVDNRVRYHVSLFRRSDGDALGVVDGRRITSLRTSATAALPAAHLFAGESVRLAVIGSGEEAREGVRALAGAVNIESAVIFSPTRANREALATEIGRTFEFEVGTATSVADALAGADVAYVATAAHEAFLSAGDLSGLRLVIAVGATHADHHELQGEVFATAAQVIVDCADAAREPGDALDAIRTGWDPGSAVLLGDWLQSPFPGNATSPILFKSSGSVEQDLVLANHLLRAAEERGLGAEVEDVGSLRIMR
jgi:alanine dehydrogenase